MKTWQLRTANAYWCQVWPVHNYIDFKNLCWRFKQQDICLLYPSKIARGIFHWQNSRHWEGKVASNPQWVGGRGQEAGLDLLLGLSADQAQRTSHQTCLPKTASPMVASKCKSANILADNQTADLYLLTPPDPHYVTISWTCKRGHRVRGKRTRSQKESGNLQNSIFAKW